LEIFSGKIPLVEVVTIIQLPQANVDGGYILGGWSISIFLEIRLKMFWRYGLLDCKVTDSVGVIQWQNTIGGNDDDILIFCSTNC
jgi:hypothetical protein